MTASPRVVALPVRADLAEYDTAAAELETALRAVPGVTSIYSLGGVSVPGISDIDRVAVTGDPSAVTPAWQKVSPRTRELAMHPPFLVSEEAFRLQRWFAHMEPLELRWGSPVETEPRPVPDYSERLLSAESLLGNLLRAIKQSHLGLIKARPALCELNNLRHALQLGRLERPASPAAWGLADRVTELRSGWFGLGHGERERAVVDLVTGAPDAIREALAALGGAMPSGAAGEVRLGPPWANVVLTADDRSRGAPLGCGSRRYLGALGARRASEALWAIRTRRVGVPGPALALIAGESVEHAGFHERRRQIVADYLAFIRRHGTGYAAIGLAVPIRP